MRRASRSYLLTQFISLPKEVYPKEETKQEVALRLKEEQKQKFIEIKRDITSELSRIFHQVYKNVPESVDNNINKKVTKIVDTVSKKRKLNTEFLVGIIEQLIDLGQSYISTNYLDNPILSDLYNLIDIYDVEESINLNEFLKKLKTIKHKKNTTKAIQQVRQETAQYG